jgi:hypothetical protein
LLFALYIIISIILGIAIYILFLKVSLLFVKKNAKYGNKIREYL